MYIKTIFSQTKFQNNYTQNAISTVITKIQKGIKNDTDNSSEIYTSLQEIR